MPRRLPLRVFPLMAVAALARADVASFEANRIAPKERLHAGLSCFDSPYLVVEPVELPSHRRIVANLLGQPMILDGGGGDAAVPIEAQPGAAEPVISKRRVENERPSEKSRRILLAQLRSAGARPLDRGRVVVHREDHVHTRTRLHETADRGRRDPPHRHDQVGVASQARQRAAQDLDGVLDGEL